MRRVSRSTESRRHDRYKQKTRPHEHLLNKNTGSDLRHTLHRLKSNTDTFFYNVGNTDKIILWDQGADAHNAGNHGSKYSRQCRARDSHRRKAKMALNQEIISDHIDHVRSHVGSHGDLRVSGTALGGVDGHGDDVEDHAAHDDPKIQDRALLSVLVGTAEADDRLRKNHRRYADQNSDNDCEDQRHQENLVRADPVFLTATSRHQGRYGYVHGDKDAQADEFRLRCQTYCRHRVCADGAHHQRVHHARQGNKKGLHHRGPSHLECDLVSLFSSTHKFLKSRLFVFRHSHHSCMSAFGIFKIFFGVLL